MKSITQYIEQSSKYSQGEYIKEAKDGVLVWIDDIRDPKEPTWQNWIKKNFGTNDFDITWIKSYKEFVDFVDKNGLPSNISLDHDLGDVEDPDNEKTGYDCAKYIVDYCMDNDRDIPNYRIQSDNGPGRENIDKYLQNYHKFYIKNK